MLDARVLQLLEVAANPDELWVGGRRLTWAEYGDPDGEVVFYFSGGDSSRLEGRCLDAAAQSLGVRVIAPDRPGFGGSDPVPDRTLGDWADDVAALADAVEARAFSVVGLSGGGPHALATAWALPTRVRSVVVVASAPAPAPRSASHGYRVPLPVLGLGDASRTLGAAFPARPASRARKQCARETDRANRRECGAGGRAPSENPPRGEPCSWRACDSATRAA